jgi:hypothetical protein
VIYLELRDAGTKPVPQYDQVPGLDWLRWIEVDYEEDIRTNLLNEENVAMRAWKPYLDIRQWPAKVPRHAPADYTMRYDGFNFRLHHYVDYAGDYAEVPGHRSYIDSTFMPLDRDHENMSCEASRQDVQDLEGLFTFDKRPIRLPYDNEVFGTRLKDPLVAFHIGQVGPSYVLELPDNDLFEPFDLTHPERYYVVDEDGEVIENGADWLLTANNEFRVLYMRPRRWRWIVTVLAHYEYADWWGSSPSDEMFISAFFNRPPFYPIRHNIGVTAKMASYDEFTNWIGEPRSYDEGLSSSWDLSWHSQDLREQILDQQWWSMCEAYIFIGNEPPDCSIIAHPPRVGEVVAGFGIVDNLSGHEETVWVVQATDASQVYPQRTIGQFLFFWDA